MYLEILETMDDAHAALVQHVYAFDVAFLIKAGHQLHAGRNLFAVLRGIDQGVDDARMVGGAVQGDGNVCHLGVYGRLAQKFHHVVEGMVGKVQQDILGAHYFEDA